MEIKEAIIKKAYIEEAIAKLLNGFIKETEMTVEHIEIKTKALRIYGGEEEVTISLDVRL